MAADINGVAQIATTGAFARHVIVLLVTVGTVVTRTTVVLIVRVIPAGRPGRDCATVVMVVWIPHPS